MSCIDLNCDMGESFGAWHMGADVEVMPWVSSINVACGFHAGDPLTMQRTLEAAAEAGVAVGAHVGLPDLVGFGRRALAVTPQELYAMTVVQLGALEAMARSCKLKPAHVKPHGALYHMLETDAGLAAALVHAVRDVDPSLRVVGFAGGRLCRVAEGAGLGTSHEGFVDRAYGSDGKLLPRDKPGAVLQDPEQMVHQAVALARDNCVTDASRQKLRLRVDTLCLHGDRNHAASVAEAVRKGLESAGVQIKHPN